MTKCISLGFGVPVNKSGGGESAQNPRNLPLVPAGYLGNAIYSQATLGEGLSKGQSLNHFKVSSKPGAVSAHLSNLTELVDICTTEFSETPCVRLT